MSILSLPVLSADHRIPYGSDPSQFGDLWIPQTSGRARAPLVVFFHGGWWRSEYDLGYAGYLCAALKREGIATWSLEYRRVGATGGGWPATFQDAAAGFAHVSKLFESYRLDLSRVITMGHSAGGHLAFWIAGRDHLPAASPLATPRHDIALRGAVALAGAVDLRLAIDLGADSSFTNGREAVYRLMDGWPRDRQEAYSAGNPGDLLPLQAPQILIQGTADDQIHPELPFRWAKMSTAIGSRATVEIVPGADHFDVVDPASKAWPTVLANVRTLLD